MKSRNIRNVSLVLTVLVVALLMGCPPGLEITPITAIAITGDEVVGETLDATSTPSGATGTYQWVRADVADGSYTPIAGATGATYDLVAADAGKYIKVTISGTNAYSGMVTSAATGPIANAEQLAPTGLAGVAPISFGGSDGKITGTTAAMEYKLSTDTDYIVAGEGETTGLLPGEYDVRFAAVSGFNAGDVASVDVPEFELIQLMITTPTLTTSKVYDGTTTAVVTAGTLGGIVGSEDVTVTAVATYDTKDAGTGKTITVVYTLDGADVANYIKPADETNTSGEITALPITAIGAISGTVKVGEELTAGTITPSGATADYQWTICNTAGGSYAEIAGATASTYTLEDADEDKFIKVVATGTGNYLGAVTSAATTSVDGLYDIGDIGPAGGLVFYKNPTWVIDGWHYLEAAPSDILLDVSDYIHIFGYHQNGSGVTILVGTASAIGTGQTNTTALVNAMGGAAYSTSFNSSLSTNPNYAARLCDILVIDTYEDWFLPSEDELNTLYTNLKVNGLGDLAADAYWSSSELTTYNAYYQNFGNWINENNDMKSQEKRVRAIRSF